MLSLVRGPIDIVSAEPLDNGAKLTIGGGSVWVEGLGLVCAGPAGLVAVQMDGRAVRIGRSGAPGKWSVKDNATVLSFSGGLSWILLHLPSCALINTDETDNHMWATFSLIMPDRYLASSGRAIQYCSLDSTGFGAWIGEYTTDMYFTGRDLMYAGQRNGKYYCWAVGQDGGLFLYNATDKNESPKQRTSFGAGASSWGYSVKHDLFLVVRPAPNTNPTVHQLYIYANDPVAVSITTPTLTPAARRGGMSVVSTRVLGDVQEPCSNRNVAFSVTQGSVDPVVVATDSDGYAKTNYYAPTGSAPAGVVLTATLEE